MFRSGGAILGQNKGIGTAAAAGLLRILHDQDPARARTAGHQWSAGSAFGLLHMQERAAERRTAGAAVVALQLIEKGQC